MRSSTWRLEDLRNVILNLGFVGENLHTRQIFDCKKMFDQYPNASVSMTVTPPEGEPYPGTIERDGDLVIWDVRDSDLVAEGDGEIQLVFTQEPHIARSYNARTHVCRSQVPTGDVPSGLDDYITRADQLLDQVEDTFPAGGTTGQVLAKKSDTDYDTEWVDQGGGTEDYDELENRPQIGGVTLTGNKTLHDLGAASEGDVEAKYTKPETGIPASDLAAGVIPDPEDLIDDEAGDGDTDKVWSADKSSSLLTEINSKADKTVTDALQKDKAPVIIDFAEGNPIVLTDGADGLPIEGMKIHFLPVQDLHGYDSPWPAGGGKNLLVMSVAKMKTDNTSGTWSGNAYTHNGVTFTVNVDESGNIVSISTSGTASEEAQFVVGRYISDGSAVVANGCPANGSTSTYRMFATNIGSDVGSGTSSVTPTSGTQCLTTIRVYEGQNSAGLVFKPMIRLASVTDDTFAPYSNICPISGWQGLTAWRTGKNLIDDSKRLAGETLCYIGATDSSYAVFLKAGTYTISCDFNNNQYEMYYREKNDEANRTLWNSGVSTLSKTFTIDKDGWFRFWVYRNTQAGGIDASNIKTVMLVTGDTATAYEEYTGASYPVTFPDGQTVYGGTLDVINGVLKVEWGKALLDDVDAWAQSGSTFLSYAGYSFNDRKTGSSWSLLCPVFPAGQASSGTACIRWGGTEAGNILVAPNGSSLTVDDLKTMSENKEIYIVYPLATPIEIQLSDIPVPVMLNGDNTIWSDANGTIELDYRADTKLFIAKNKQDIRATIAPIEDGTTASKAYSAGKLFYHNGNLCKAKTSIASGATFTLNTNYIITTVADELFALN